MGGFKMVNYKDLFEKEMNSSSIECKTAEEQNSYIVWLETQLKFWQDLYASLYSDIKRLGNKVHEDEMPNEKQLTKKDLIRILGIYASQSYWKKKRGNLSIKEDYLRMAGNPFREITDKEDGVTYMMCTLFYVEFLENYINKLEDFNNILLMEKYNGSLHS